MAAWMVTANFAFLIVILVVVLTCLGLTVYKILTPSTATGCTGLGGCAASSASLMAAAGAPMASAAMFGSAVDGDQTYENKTELRLTKDAFFRNLTLIGSTIEANGYSVRVAGTLTMTKGSIIRNPGRRGADTNALAGNGPVPGGKGGAHGTLGGGGAGGYGYLKDESQPNRHGEPSYRTPIFGGGGGGIRHNGADAAVCPILPEAKRSKGGEARGYGQMRATASIMAALSGGPPSFPGLEPARLLGGGGGGGGGLSERNVPGSGGGGGGGVVLVAARKLVVSQAGDGILDASGGDAGAIVAAPLARTASGGGGGGGLIVLATMSEPAEYAGLALKVAGGQYVDALGRSQRASSGRVIDWHRAMSGDAKMAGDESEEEEVQEEWAQTATWEAMAADGGGPQEVEPYGGSRVAFANVLRPGGHSCFDMNGDGTVLTARRPGMYLVSAQVAVQHFSRGIAKSAVVLNGDPDAHSFGQVSLSPDRFGTDGAHELLSIVAPVRLRTKDTVEIRARLDGPPAPLRLAPGSLLSIVLLHS
jgi:hypothetical protein